jgi:hypothetical protein
MSLVSVRILVQGASISFSQPISNGEQESGKSFFCSRSSVPKITRKPGNTPKLIFVMNVAIAAVVLCLVCASSDCCYWDLLVWLSVSLPSQTGGFLSSAACSLVLLFRVYCNSSAHAVVLSVGVCCACVCLLPVLRLGDFAGQHLRDAFVAGGSSAHSTPR